MSWRGNSHTQLLIPEQPPKAFKDDSVDLTPIIFKTSMPHLVYGSVLAWRNSRFDLMMGDTLILEIFNAVMLMIIELNIT